MKLLILKEITKEKNHYERVLEFYKKHVNEDGTTTFDFGYDVKDFFDISTGTLTPLFYKGDRSMREGGFDPSCKFGQFNVDIVHYAPVVS